MRNNGLLSKLAIAFAFAAAVVLGTTTFAMAQVDCTTTSTGVTTTTVVDPYDPYSVDPYATGAVAPQSANGAAVPAQIDCVDGGQLPITGSNAAIALGAAAGLLGLAYAARRAAQNQI